MHIAFQEDHGTAVRRSRVVEMRAHARGLRRTPGRPVAGRVRDPVDCQRLLHPEPAGPGEIARQPARCLGRR